MACQPQLWWGATGIRKLLVLPLMRMPPGNKAKAILIEKKDHAKLGVAKSRSGLDGWRKEKSRECLLVSRRIQVFLYLPPTLTWKSGNWKQREEEWCSVLFPTYPACLDLPGGRGGVEERVFGLPHLSCTDWR
ncbi:hypothetical protein E2C01_022544 [Portunus trituberculatus]|uniref:Uncharacterized protein n=1 Tax=Portunus trituberculatus TaxID=210409 RepID=A0A5B7E7X9_PORTR|nr:hypothetical protein [Portunus trituberculatus]